MNIWVVYLLYFFPTGMGFEASFFNTEKTQGLLDMVRFSSTAGNNWSCQFPSIPAYFFFLVWTQVVTLKFQYTPSLKKLTNISPTFPLALVSQWFSSFSRESFPRLLESWPRIWANGMFLGAWKMAGFPRCKLGLFVSEFAEIWSRRFLLLNFGGLGGSVFPEFVYLKEYVTIATYTINFGGSWEKNNFHGIHFF